MHVPGELLGDGSGLVALHGAYEVPLQTEVRERRDFFHGFLRIAFAESPLTGVDGLFDI